MDDSFAVDKQEAKLRAYYFSALVFITFGAVISFLLGAFTVTALLVMIPALFFGILKFQDYYIEYFIASLFVARFLYWPLRIQSSLIMTVLLVIFLISSRNFGIFNNLALPVRMKVVTALMIVSVLVSATLSQFASGLSVYFAVLFIMFVSLSYVIFRSVKGIEDIDRYLLFFAIFCGVSGLSTIAQIFVTGNLRSLGISSFPIMDFTAMALVTLVFRNFLLSKPRLPIVLLSLVIFVVLITTQSRFAWLGFLLTFIYGLIICSIYSPEAKSIIRKRLPIFAIVSVVGVAVVFIFGLHSVLLNRLNVDNFKLFQFSSGQLTSNSLETRLFIWVTAYNTLIHNPLIGVGYLMFSEVSEFYNILPEFVFNMYVYGLDAHTTYLNFLVETGVIGLTIFITYVVSIFILTLRAIRESVNMINLRVSIVLNLLVFFIMVHSIYSGAFTMGQNALHMHFIFGLAVANSVMTRKAYLEKN